MTSICYINPASDITSYYGAEALAAAGYAPACVVADLAIATVAALTPRDFDIRLVDESITPIDYDMDVDFVGITGKSSQVEGMIRIADEFRARGRRVLIGGPFASLSPHRVRAHCDILVRGEIETIADELFADLRAGTWRDEYLGGRPDISSSPVPRWDLYPNDRAIDGALQTSRGCPFECEFCDVIQYLGRKQRFKTGTQIAAELDELHRHGYRRIFLCDDNFTVARKRAREVLGVLKAWNARHRDDGAMAFHTQASIEASEDPELLHLCVEAGLTTMFVGIETPNEDSLRETHKYQNLRHSLADSIERFVSAGIALRGGMIAGFDADGPDIFERQYEFGMSVPVPIFNVTALVAQEATPLYARLARDGRVIEDRDGIIGALLATNIVPQRMSREELLAGLRWLGNQLYRPAAYMARMRHFIRLYRSEARESVRTSPGWQKLRAVDRDQVRLIKDLRQLGPEEDAMCREVFDLVAKKPEAGAAVMEMMLSYAQLRHAYTVSGYWEPASGAGRSSMLPAPSPSFRASASASRSMVG